MHTHTVHCTAFTWEQSVFLKRQNYIKKKGCAFSLVFSILNTGTHAWSLLAWQLGSLGSGWSEKERKCEQAPKTRAKVSFRTWPWKWHAITSTIFSWTHRSPLARCGRRLHRCEYLEVGILGSHHEGWWAMEYTTTRQWKPWIQALMAHISHWS